MKVTDLPVEILLRVLVFTLPSRFQKTPLFKSSSILDIARRHRSQAKADDHFYYRHHSAYLDPIYLDPIYLDQIYLNQIYNFARTNMQFYRAVRMYQSGIHILASGDLLTPDTSWGCARQRRWLEAAEQFGVGPMEHTCPSPVWHARPPLRSVDLSALKNVKIPAMRKCFCRLSPSLTNLTIRVEKNIGLVLHKIPFKVLRAVSLQMMKPDKRALQMILGALSELAPTDKYSSVRILNITYNRWPKTCEENVSGLTFPRLDTGLSEFTTSACRRQRPGLNIDPVISDIRDALRIRWRRSHEPLFVENELTKLVSSCEAWKRRGRKTNSMKRLDGSLDEKAIFELMFNQNRMLGEDLLWGLISLPRLRSLTVGISDSNLYFFQRLCKANADVMSIIRLRYHADASSSASTQVFSKIYAGLFELKHPEELDIYSFEEELIWDLHNAVRCAERLWKKSGSGLVSFRLSFKYGNNGLRYDRAQLQRFHEQFYRLAAVYCHNLEEFEVKFFSFAPLIIQDDFQYGDDSIYTQAIKLRARIPGLSVH